jgi:hypothetical protein
MADPKPKEYTQGDAAAALALLEQNIAVKRAQRVALAEQIAELLPQLAQAKRLLHAFTPITRARKATQAALPGTEPETEESGADGNR